MAHKIAIALLSVLYALHIMYAVCEDTEPGEDDYYYDALAEPMNCTLVNSTAGVMVHPNCTVICHNATNSWNQTAPENSTCYASYNEQNVENLKSYTCLKGHCHNGTCIEDNEYVACG
ncbi:hypothetical protein MTO96_043105 [Rhipicephalus appendiculatus]